MSKTVMIEIPAESEKLVRKVLAMQEEANALALSAPSGQVLDVCEAAMVAKGPKLEADILAEAVAKRVEEAEKKGSAANLRLR